MRALISKIKPASGFSYLLHLGLLVLLPAAVFILVRIQFTQLAFSIVLLSKWRMLAVRPRFWPAILRANAVDLMVGLSIVIFMTHSGSMLWQLIWAVAYGIWLVVIKPSSWTPMVSIQAGIGQLCGLMALFVAGASGPLYGLVFATGLICYLAARHFFDSYEEGYAKLLSYLWGYFGAALMWVLGHWLLFYGIIAQPTLLLSVLGYGLAVLYAFDHHDKLSVMIRRQIIFIMFAVVVVVLAVSDWGSKVV
jgi:hypothetical protein